MKRFYDAVCRAEVVFAWVMLILMVLLIFGACIARVAGHPINWAIDMATCFFAWACFFCSDIAWRNDKLMSVDLMVNLLPAKGRKYCRMANYAILTVFLSYVVCAGLWLSYVSRARAFQGIPAISYSWVTLSLPVGGILLLITTLIKVRREITGGWQGPRCAAPPG
jgi:TRAP-type C4-dicarboxylate transport system permease small subunit